MVGGVISNGKFIPFKNDFGEKNTLNESNLNTSRRPMIKVCDLTWEELVWLSLSTIGLLKIKHEIESVTRNEEGKIEINLKEITLGESNG